MHSANLYKFRTTWSRGTVTETREGWVERRTMAAAAAKALKILASEWYGDQPTAIDLRIELKPKER